MIGCKWVLHKKLKPDRSVDKYKSRLVAKGFKQLEGLECYDIFSQVTRIVSIRHLVAIASILDLQIYQIDVKVSF